MIKRNRLKLLLSGFLLLPGMIFAQQLPYRQSSLPISERVDDLLGRMTLEEKIAQIRHIHSWNVFNGQDLDMEKLGKFTGGVSWGFVEGFPLTGVNCKKNMQLIQKFMVENTRLGIYRCGVIAWFGTRGIYYLSSEYSHGEYFPP